MCMYDSKRSFFQKHLVFHYEKVNLKFMENNTTRYIQNQQEENYI